MFLFSRLRQTHAACAATDTAGDCGKASPPEKKTCGKISFQNTKSGAGELVLLLGFRAKAHLKGRFRNFLQPIIIAVWCFRLPFSFCCPFVYDMVKALCCYAGVLDGVLQKGLDALSTKWSRCSAATRRCLT